MTLDGSDRLVGHGQRPSPFAVALVFAFLAESLLSRTHLDALFLSTPVHIAATAGLSGMLVALALVRGLSVPPPSIALPLVTLICLAFLTSAYSPDFTVFNLVFATVWTLHFVAIWWAVPSLLRGGTVDLVVDLFLAVAITVLILSILFAGPERTGRFAGFFNTATQVGRMGALAAVWGFSEWVLGRRSGVWAVVLVASAAMVLASRTRASMGAMVIGCSFVLLHFLFSSEGGQRLRAGLAFFVVFAAAVAGFLVLDVGLVELQGSLSYLRLGGGLSGVMSARTTIWLAGLDRLATAGWLGEGFSEKFGGFAAEKWGIRYPTYDWIELVDPHNMLMTTAIQLGLPAAVILLIVLVALGRTLGRLPLRQRALGMGVFAVGLVFGLVDGNWFITFSPPDRVSMTLLSLLVASRFQSGSAIGQADDGEGRPAP